MILIKQKQYLINNIYTVIVELDKTNSYTMLRNDTPINTLTLILLYFSKADLYLFNSCYSTLKYLKLIKVTLQFKN